MGQILKLTGFENGGKFENSYITTRIAYSMRIIKLKKSLDEQAILVEAVVPKRFPALILYYK